MVMTVIYFLGGLDHLSDHVIALHPSSCVMRCPSIIKQFYFLREEVFDKSICICETVTSPAGPNMQTGYFGKKKILILLTWVKKYIELTLYVLETLNRNCEVCVLGIRL